MCTNYGCDKRSYPLKIIKMGWAKSIVGLDFNIGFFWSGLIVDSMKFL